MREVFGDEVAQVVAYLVVVPDRVTQQALHPVGGGVTGMFGGRGGGGGRQRVERGRDLEATVAIGFDQSINGTEVSVSVPRHETCDTCHGNGAAPGTSPKTCPRCQGAGVENVGQGMFSISQPCSQCHGKGTIVDTPCPTCHGDGVVLKTRKYRVKIPAGVRDGARIRVAGKGEAGENGGAAGDLATGDHRQGRG